MFDVAIIGAGIAGAGMAWSLGQRSGGKLRVALLEMESQPGYHTTGRSAASWVRRRFSASLTSPRAPTASSCAALSVWF